MQKAGVDPRELVVGHLDRLLELVFDQENEKVDIRMLVPFGLWLTRSFF